MLCGSYIKTPTYMNFDLSIKIIRDLEVIEVQTGSYFGENDIVRYEDLYVRV